MKIFTTERIARHLDSEQLSRLVIEFKKYQNSSEAGEYFGRDASLDRPQSAKFAELQHIHTHPNFLTGLPVNMQTNQLRTWRIHGRQYDKRSDSWLIYCHGVRMQDNILLLAFLKDDAHSRANQVSFIGQLADEAEAWRAKY